MVFRSHFQNQHFVAKLLAEDDRQHFGDFNASLDKLKVEILDRRLQETLLQNTKLGPTVQNRDLGLECFDMLPGQGGDMARSESEV